MELSQDQSKALHKIITAWLKTQGIIDKDADYEITVTQIYRKFVNLKLQDFPTKFENLVVTKVSDFFRDKKCSTKLMNILCRSNYWNNTLGNLVQCSRSEILRLNQCGFKIVQELEDVLATVGLCLQMRFEIGLLEKAILKSQGMYIEEPEENLGDALEK